MLDRTRAGIRVAPAGTPANTPRQTFTSGSQFVGISDRDEELSDTPNTPRSLVA